MDSTFRLENKEIILIALCVEHRKAIPHFEHVRPAALGMSGYAFSWALMKLQTEELIDGVDISKGYAQWESFWPTKEGVKEGQKLYEMLRFHDPKQFERFPCLTLTNGRRLRKRPAANNVLASTLVRSQTAWKRTSSVPRVEQL